MKIQRFLECVTKKLLNYPDIDLVTLKLFMDKFDKCLSKNERERNSLLLQIISEHTSKQIKSSYLTEIKNKKKEKR